MADLPDETTDDRFLGGKLILRQPKRGHRAGHDALLLAASTQATKGQSVVDLGAGVGTAGLALARRVDGIDLVLVEIDPWLAELAAFNARANAIPARVVAADVTAPHALKEIGSIDRVMMNPPFHPLARHRPSPEPTRRMAHAADDDTLPAWIDVAHRLLKPRGALTLIWRADDLARVLKVTGAKFGSLVLQPVYGVQDKPAVRILLRATKGGRAPLLLLRPAVLDGSDVDVEAAMRGEATLALAEDTPASKMR